ncbi:MAG: cupin domain-containing protein [Parasphingopyxis sp.]|uniref:cupin domain-containing protein n=1 Tax=Parasphingopyxis sp. TaxID=1920299 RepID=UPI003FA1243D
MAGWPVLLAALLQGGVVASEPCVDPVYMVVAGPTHDRERMMAYGQAIADSQIYDRLGGYYVNSPRAVATFEGDAPPGYTVLIVRFPCLANARTFWNSDVYQNEILPLRRNPSAGDYFVTVYPEIPPRPEMVGKVGEADYLVRFEGGDIPERPVYADPPGLVLGVDAETAARAEPGGGWPAGGAVVLRRDAATGEAYRLSFDAAASFRVDPPAQLTEIYVERGAMALSGRRLAAGDYMRIPAGSATGITGVVEGTRLLLFRDPGPGSGAATTVSGAERPWRTGDVAREAGAAAPLYIRDLYEDAETGARTFLVRLAAGVSVPWEIHSTAEEGYLLDGDYRLAECLPSGRRDYDYMPGGYFYRPAGVMHSGPDSTTTTGATWLIRTPRTLDALFYPACPSAPAAPETDRQEEEERP